jgi:hypothetical protein
MRWLRRPETAPARGSGPLTAEVLDRLDRHPVVAEVRRELAGERVAQREARIAAKATRRVALLAALEGFAAEDAIAEADEASARALLAAAQTRRRAIARTRARAVTEADQLDAVDNRELRTTVAGFEVDEAGRALDPGLLAAIAAEVEATGRRLLPTTTGAAAYTDAAAVGAMRSELVAATRRVRDDWPLEAWAGDAVLVAERKAELFGRLDAAARARGLTLTWGTPETWTPGLQ